MNLIALFARQVRVAFGHGVLPLVVEEKYPRTREVRFYIFDRRRLAADGQVSFVALRSSIQV